MTRTKHRIGGYRVIAPIGAGGFATVYRALDESTKAEVAIKVLAENHSLVPDTRRRFVEEVSLLATVNSPAIAEIYEVGETETGQPYMVLELADRGDLRRRLEEIRRSHQVLNRADLTMLAHHLYESLATLHDADIVHRDVSPGNILIRSRDPAGQRNGQTDRGVTLLEPGERFLLADLGHAKDLIQASGFTAGGGTRGFAPPEQTDDISVVDHRADVFSATAVLEWAAHDGEYATDLEPFFDTGLAADPDDRFADMTEWHTAFSAALGSTGDGDGPRAIPGFGALAAVVGRVSEGLEPKLIGTAVFALALLATLTYGVVAQLNGGDTDSSDELATVVIAGASVDGETPPLRVTTDADLADPSTTNSAATTGSASTASSVQSTTTAGQTTTGQATTTTTPATTTTSPPTTGDGARPAAVIEQPEDGAVVTGRLVITGTATFDQGIRQVDVVLKNVDTRSYWNPETRAFQTNWIRFQASLSGSGGEVTWETAVLRRHLEPGNYLIRVWARGVGGQNDPTGDSHTIEIR